MNKKLFILGLVGYEEWNSSKSYVYKPLFVNKPDSKDRPKTKDFKNEEGVVDSTKYNEALASYTAEEQAYTDYRNTPSQWGEAVAAPMEYQDLAYGIGFDWDFSPRVGLHGRVKKFFHKDVGLAKILEDINEGIKV